MLALITLRAISFGDMDAKQIGARLRKAREACGYTPSVFADMLGVKYNYLHQVERGERKLSLEKHRRACRLLGVTSDWLLGITKDGGPDRKGGAK